MTVKVYHVTRSKNVKSIFKNGIIPNYRIDQKYINLRKGVRKRSVYAYPKFYLETLGQWGSPDDVLIEIAVDPEQVFIGELRAEHQPEMYWRQFMTLKDYMRTGWNYIEPEIVIPFKVETFMLTGVILNRKTLEPIYRRKV